MRLVIIPALHEHLERVDQREIILRPSNTMRLARVA
jgi:hypothetical protein